MHRFNLPDFCSRMQVCFGFCVNPTKFGWRGWRCQIGVTLPPRARGDHVPKLFFQVLLRHFEILNSFCRVMSICVCVYTQKDIFPNSSFLPCGSCRKVILCFFTLEWTKIHALHLRAMECHFSPGGWRGLHHHLPVDVCKVRKEVFQSRKGEFES